MTELTVSLICFFISALLLIVLFAILNSSKTKNTPSTSTTAKVNAPNSPKPKDKEPKSTPLNQVYDGAGKTLIKYFNICKAIIASEDSLEYVSFELMCLLYYVSKYTAHYKSKLTNINLEKYIEEINNYTLSKLSNTQTPFPILISKTDCLIKRIEFYDKIVTERRVRGDWLSSDLPEDMHPLFLCSVALGDILVNPDCGIDYYKAPVVIRDFFKARETEKKLILLCDAINEYSCVVLKYAT